MFFEWSTHAIILFEPWVTTTWYFYALSCIAVAVLSVGLEWLRLIYHQVAHAENRQLTKTRRCGEALLYGGYIATSYLVMLVVMTYNIGLCLGVIVGYIVGHFLFPRGSVPETSPERKSGAMYSPVSVSEPLGCH